MQSSLREKSLGATVKPILLHHTGVHTGFKCYLGLLLMSELATPRVAAEKTRESFLLVIHGGAGVISRKQMTPETETEHRVALKTALQTGYDLLKASATSIEAVSAAIKVLEDSPLF